MALSVGSPPDVVAASTRPAHRCWPVAIVPHREFTDGFATGSPAVDPPFELAVTGPSERLPSDGRKRFTATLGAAFRYRLSSAPAAGGSYTRWGFNRDSSGFFRDAGTDAHVTPGRMHRVSRERKSERRRLEGRARFELGLPPETRTIPDWTPARSSKRTLSRRSSSSSSHSTPVRRSRRDETLRSPASAIEEVDQDSAKVAAIGPAGRRGALARRKKVGRVEFLATPGELGRREAKMPPRFQNAA